MAITKSPNREEPVFFYEVIRSTKYTDVSIVFWSFIEYSEDEFNEIVERHKLYTLEAYFDCKKEMEQRYGLMLITPSQRYIYNDY